MENEKKGNGSKWFFGCCGGLLIFMMLLAGGGYYGAGWAKNKGVTAMREGIAESLKDSELSAEETGKINSQMERLETAVKGWGVIEALKHMGNLKDVEGDVKNIGFHAILLSYGQFVLPRTDMPEEERVAGRRTLERFARGVDEGKLSVNEDDKAWELDGKREDDKTVFDVEQVRAHLVQLKAQADAAEIPDEPYQVEIAAKLESIIDAFIAE